MFVKSYLFVDDLVLNNYDVKTISSRIKVMPRLRLNTYSEIFIIHNGNNKYYEDDGDGYDDEGDDEDVGVFG